MDHIADSRNIALGSTVSHTRALVERTIDDDRRRYSRYDRSGGLGDHPALGDAAERNLAVPAKVNNAESTDKHRLRDVVVGVADDAVDVGRFEAGVIECGENRLKGELPLGPSGVFRELRLSNPYHRRFLAHIAHSSGVTLTAFVENTNRS